MLQAVLERLRTDPGFSGCFKSAPEGDRKFQGLSEEIHGR